MPSFLLSIIIDTFDQQIIFMKKIYTFFTLVLLITSSKAQIVNISDAAFKARLLQASTSIPIAKNAAGQNIKIDTNNDSNIQVSEALLVYQLFVSSPTNIVNLTGIESFTNLTTFDCSSEAIIVADFTGNVNLQTLKCYNNQISSLNIANCVALETLQCSMNELTTLDVSHNVNLDNFSCTENQLTSLDVSNNVNLTWLYCGINPISSIDVTNNLLLNIFSCTYSLVSEIDISNNWRITDFTCQGNPNLTHLNIKNNERYAYWNNLDFFDCPNLVYVCCDEADLTLVQQKIDTYGYTCNANTYCSFEPTGYLIHGVARLDTNNNGCDDTDVRYPNLKFKITNSSDNALLGNFISTATGNYTIMMPSGGFIVRPLLEVASYFNVTPVSTYVAFSNSSPGPFEKNFCLNANGVHSDVEVVLIPTIIPPRPGFDSSYKIIYRNKGNQVSDGILTLAFNDAILDYVSSSLVVTNQSEGLFTWNYSNLMPFETREFEITFNVNSPTEIPPVIAGDYLNYTATIVGATDETPSDNTFVLNHFVRNSYDPNDKTCLQGDTITPSEVGKYVHYVIRFENTGTFPATNVVLRDVIDASKFDITTLVALSGSHNYETRIMGSDRIEFIFENINLPFDDANNDGYVAFKIKTKPNLVLGDSFSNKASIYFDYNFPIVTNTATTTIATLGTSDFEFNSMFTISPVPTKSVLNISKKQNLVVTSVSIYTMLGQLVQVDTNPDEIINVFRLTTGTYFIKIRTDKGTAVSKFMKE